MSEETGRIEVLYEPASEMVRISYISDDGQPAVETVVPLEKVPDFCETIMDCIAKDNLQPSNPKYQMFMDMFDLLKQVLSMNAHTLKARKTLN